jgi:hypothetical protein
MTAPIPVHDDQAHKRIRPWVKIASTIYRRRTLKLVAGTNVTITPTEDAPNDELQVSISSTGGGGGAPIDADYLVGTANPTLTNEIVVGTSPGGELGGTWASPTVDATHSGSAHHNEVHVLADGGALGPDHTMSGANAGEVLRALSPTTAAFDQLGFADLSGAITSAQHGTIGSGDLHPEYAADADLAAHVAAADPHPTYALDTDLPSPAPPFAAGFPGNSEPPWSGGLERF